MEYKIRGGMLYTNTDNIHAVEGIITDSNGEQKYKLVGKYTSKIDAINLKTGERWTVFEAPELPPKSSEMHNMNYFSLQLNMLSDDLRSKLPPTDSRLREDVRAWEFGELETSGNEKTKLEQNQRIRRKQVKELLKSEGVEMNMYDEQQFYCPKFFDKQVITINGKAEYKYNPKPGNVYWKMRETRNWSTLPPIFEDDCAPFYK